MKRFIILAVLAAFGSCAFAQETKTKPHYEGEVALGYSLSLNDMGNLDYIVFETVHGIRFMPYLFAGVGTGLHLYHTAWYDIYNTKGQKIGHESLAGAMQLPLFANIKGYYPMSDKFAVYVSADFGGIIGINKISGGHFYTSVGPGIQVGRKKAFDFSLRYQYTGGDLLLARLGLRF